MTTGTPEIDRSVFPDRDPQLMFEVAKDRLSNQLSFIDALDAKLAVLVSVASALLAIAAAVFALHAATTTTTATGAIAAVGVSGWDLAVLAFGALVYALVAWFGGKAYRCRDWNVGPTLEALWDEHYTGDSDRRIKWGVAADMWLDYEHNQTAYTTKERALHWVFIGTALETVALVAAISLVAAGV